MQPPLRALLANKKFVAVVGMLGSNGPGEAANAAAMATKMLREAGTTWGELLAALGQPGGSVKDAAWYGAKESLLQAEINRLQDRIRQLQRKEEASETRARRAENQLRDVRAELKASVEREQILQSKLRAAEAKKGWTFGDDVAGTEWVPPAPRAHHNWLEDVLHFHAHKLSEWETNFLTDFAEKNKPIKSERQYGVFRRIAEKIGVPLGF